MTWKTWTPGFLVLLFTLALVAVGGEYNQELEIGDVAPSWKELPGTDGKLHGLADLQDKSVVVLAFTCNSCPYAVDYEDRLVELATKYGGEKSQVAVVAVNVNRVEEDSLPNMKAKAQEKKFTFPYLYDESQQIAKNYGATRTPEFFVLDQDRKVVYMGALDDNTDASKVTRHYVADAIEAALKGKPAPVAETVPIGCGIRFVRERGKRSTK